MVPSERMRSSGHKLRHRKLYFNMKKKLFMLKVTECRSRLSREDVESVSGDLQNPLNKCLAKKKASFVK